MTERYERRKTYARDNEDRRGQRTFFFAPGATISTQQAANILGISDATVRAMCEQGDLEWFRVRPEVIKSPIRVIADSVYRHIGKVADHYALKLR